MHSKTIILKDKMIKTGSSPIYDDQYNEIGSVHYHFFSLKGKVELKDHEGNLVSTGGAKLLSFMPQWNISNSNGEKIGTIRRNFSFIGKKYTYLNKDGKVFKIKGNIWDRKFEVYNERGEVAISVRTLSSIISLRPHTFAIEIQRDFDMWEAINLIQGVRSLVKKEEDAKNAHDGE